MKPAGVKPNSSGRGFYPGQPVKHGTGGSGNGDHRTNGLVPPKGPPPLQQPTLPISVNPYRPVNHSRNLPKLNIDNVVSIDHSRKGYKKN